MLRYFLRVSALVFALFPLSVTAQTESVSIDQGHHWTDARKHDFYVGDQGSRIMPLKWMRALETTDGDSFLHDALDRSF